MVASSSTTDDVQGTMERHIPTEYFTSEEDFLVRVEQDAETFRPVGTKIHSYTRPSPASVAKGKGAAVTLQEDDEDAVVFEVWHVSYAIIQNPDTLIPSQRNL